MSVLCNIFWFICCILRTCLHFSLTAVVQRAWHAKAKESQATKTADKAKQLAQKSAIELKSKADIKMLSDEKVAELY